MTDKKIHDDRQLVFISSATLSSGTRENFSHRIELSEKFDRCAVIDVSIPRSFYNVIESFSTISVIEDANPAVDIVLTPGNYSTFSLPSILVPLMDAALTGTYTMEFNKVTGKFVITAAGITNFSLTMSTKLANLFGIDGTTKASTGLTWVSDIVVDFSYNRIIKIHSSLAENEEDNLLHLLYVDSEAYSTVRFSSHSERLHSVKISTNKSNIYSFSLYDVEDTLLQLNGIDWHCSLLFYKSSKTDELLDQLIKLTAMSIDE